MAIELAAAAHYFGWLDDRGDKTAIRDRAIRTVAAQFARGDPMPIEKNVVLPAKATQKRDLARPTDQEPGDRHKN